MFEHFYDLCFVVVLAELVDYLTENTLGGAIVVFVVLFIPVWFIWTATTYFTNRFGTDDWLERVLIGAQLLAVAALALSVHGGLDVSAPMFSISYAVASLMVAALYLKARWQFPEYKSFSTIYLIGHTVAAVVWGVSAIIPNPTRFAFWAAGLLVALSLPLISSGMKKRAMLRMASIPERFRIFSVIVLSEAIKNVVDGLSEHGLTPIGGIAAALSFVLACAIWWVYFDNVDGRHLREDTWAWRIWANAHLPILAAFAAASGGVERLAIADQSVPLPSATLWLLCGSVAVCLISIAGIHLVTDERSVGLRLAIVRASSGFAAIAIGIVGSRLKPVWIIALLAAACAAQVVIDLVSSERTDGDAPLTAAVGSA